jgi:hypothetical protein
MLHTVIQVIKIHEDLAFSNPNKFIPNPWIDDVCNWKIMAVPYIPE